MSQSILKAAAGIAALAAIAFGASAIASGNKSSSTSVAGPGAQGGQPPGMNGARPPRGMNGGPPPGAGRFGRGPAVTGATAAKVKAAALAEYPGTIERIEQTPDGGYVAHVIRSSGELHVLVSKQFVVTGTATGPPGRPGTGKPGSAQPGSTS
jgi:hypothetical protein